MAKMTSRLICDGTLRNRLGITASSSTFPKKTPM